MIVFLFCIAAAHGKTPDKNPHPLSAIKFIDVEKYIRSDDYAAIFTGGKWQDAKGIWYHIISSSGIHRYIELEFTGKSKFIHKSGIRLTLMEKDENENSRTGACLFDPGSAFLILTGKNTEEKYHVDYFTATDIENLIWEEILVLTATDEPGMGEPSSYTFLR
ncbi:MAG: hypothetical protein LIO77_04745 [Rikenellaceae bacterium]|nr:hypothetical protein [Rikenellaceae bacterium]